MIDLYNKDIIKDLKELLEKEGENNWKGTLFEEYIREGSTAVKGLIGESISKMLLQDMCYNVIWRHRGDTEYDLIVNKQKLEVKSSIQNKARNRSFCSGGFTHINPALDWDYLVLLSGFQDKVFFRCLSKQDFIKSIGSKFVYEEAYLSKKYPGQQYYCIRGNKSNSSELLNNTQEITNESFKSV